MKEWQIESTEQYIRDYKYYAKKHKEELKAVLDNLDNYLKVLQECNSPLLIKRGFIHMEPMGIKALDQKSGKTKRKLQATRLYVYPDKETHSMILLAIGNKNTQSTDIERCKNMIRAIKGGK
jgi:Lhr-like helicase